MRDKDEEIKTGKYDLIKGKKDEKETPETE